MYLDGNLVGCARVDYRQVALPGYLGSVKRELQKKHITLLEAAGSEPEFLLAKLSVLEKPENRRSPSLWQ